jgi:hypothetical protein
VLGAVIVVVNAPPPLVVTVVLPVGPETVTGLFPVKYDP